MERQLGSRYRRRRRRCDQIGRFLKFLATNFLIKVAQICGYVLGQFWKTLLFSKNCGVNIFWTNFVKIKATFNCINLVALVTVIILCCPRHQMSNVMPRTNVGEEE